MAKDETVHHKIEILTKSIPPTTREFEQTNRGSTRQPIASNIYYQRPQYLLASTVQLL